MRHRRGCVAVGICLSAALLGSGPAASAADSCTYDSGSHTVTLVLAAGTNTVLLRDGIRIASTSGFCGDATIHNTDLISVVGTPDSDELVLLETVSSFPRRIGFTLDLAANDYLAMYRGDSNDTITFGADGIARDSDDSADMRFTDAWPIMRLDTGGGRDRVSGQGGHGTGAATTEPLVVSSGGGDDQVTGGEGRDWLTLNGYPAAQQPAAGRLRGMGGEDRLAFDPNLTDQVISGGSGIDTVITGASLPVLISLDGVDNDGVSMAGDNVRPDVENLTVASTSGLLVGDGDANVLRGGSGPDTIIGGGGADMLIGRNGADSLVADDGEGDRLRGGDGYDTASVDCDLDRLVEVEFTGCP